MANNSKSTHSIKKVEDVAFGAIDVLYDVFKFGFDGEGDVHPAYLTQAISAGQTFGVDFSKRAEKMEKIVIMSFEKLLSIMDKGATEKDPPASYFKLAIQVGKLADMKFDQGSLNALELIKQQMIQQGFTSSMSQSITSSFEKSLEVAQHSGKFTLN